MSAKVSPQSTTTMTRKGKEPGANGDQRMDHRQFLDDESGAVTVDWVVLTAGVVVFAIFVMPPIQTAIVNMAIYIGDTIAEYSKFLQ
jgi:Flp pilus assembly pilin Flp